MLRGGASSCLTCRVLITIHDAALYDMLFVSFETFLNLERRHGQEAKRPKRKPPSPAGRILNFKLRFCVSVDATQRQSVCEDVPHGLTRSVWNELMMMMIPRAVLIVSPTSNFGAEIVLLLGTDCNL